MRTRIFLLFLAAFVHRVCQCDHSAAKDNVIGEKYSLQGVCLYVLGSCMKIV